MKHIILLLTIFLTIGCKEKNVTEIKIGGLFDLTGATHEICAPYVRGIRNCFKYINERNGINGRPVRLIEMDYSYLIPRAKKAYAKLVNKDKVTAILGWGTGDTEILRLKIASDKIPFMSASYSANLGKIKEAPYNFLIGVTYSDQIRIILNYIASKWKNKSRKVRVAFIYNSTQFGKSPIADGRTHALKNNIDLVSEEIVELDAREANEQLKRIKDKEADFAIIHETTWAASVILKNAKSLNMKTKFFGLNWCVDEKLIALTGKASEGFIGAIPFLFTDKKLPGLKKILEYNKQKNINLENYILRYIQGWTTAMVLFEGIKNAGNNITGKSIKEGLENLKNFDTGGITALITFSISSHLGCNKLKLGIVKNGKWKTITDYISAEK